MSTSSKVALVWFRRDLRLADNPALSAARSEGYLVVPVYIWDPEAAGEWAPGAASRWWLHHSLTSLQDSLSDRGLKLILRQGPSLQELRALLEETGASAVFWNRQYEPWAIERDTEIKRSLRESGVVAESRNGNYLIEPGSVRTQSGAPYKVFTAFWKQARGRALDAEVLRSCVEDQPLKGAETLKVRSVSLGSLGLLPQLDWADGFGSFWEPGEGGAHASLERFLSGSPQEYPDRRDFPAVAGVSRLSPHLAFGEIAPQRIAMAFRDAVGRGPEDSGWIDNAFVTELGWREFANGLLFHFPHTVTEPLRSDFQAFPWEEDATHFKAWSRGVTGYPIVDAGMRELWGCGWMHNRVRMIVASFLVKHLRIHWLEGAKWFWDTLVDADLASNTLGWQWSAGCGADAAPYFRVFNPELQMKRYDERGAYVRRWAPDSLVGGEGHGTYPAPIVDHRSAREGALAAFDTLKKNKGGTAGSARS